MSRFPDIIKSVSFRRIISLLIVVCFFFLTKDLLNIFLLTFVFIYVLYRFEILLKFFFKNINQNILKFIQVLLFLIVMGGLIYVLIHYAPSIYNQIRQIIIQTNHFYRTPSSNDIINVSKDFIKKLSDTVLSTQGFQYITSTVFSISKIGLNILLSFILSLFFILGKDSVIKFASHFKASIIRSFVKEVEYFGKKFINSFGKVMEVQIVVALINGAVSTIGLYIIGFPNVIGLGIMITFLGLIPVAGVFISLLPLCIVAFNTGGIMYVLYTISLVTVIHVLESYFLNPKLMSSKTKLPVFIIFMVLIFSEHFFGIWGLVIGVPAFVFLLDLLNVPHLGLKD